MGSLRFRGPCQVGQSFSLALMGGTGALVGGPPEGPSPLPPREDTVRGQPAGNQEMTLTRRLLAP